MHHAKSKASRQKETVVLHMKKISVQRDLSFDLLDNGLRVNQTHNLGLTSLGWGESKDLVRLFTRGSLNFPLKTCHESDVSCLRLRACSRSMTRDRCRMMS